MYNSTDGAIVQVLGLSMGRRNHVMVHQDRFVGSGRLRRVSVFAEMSYALTLCKLVRNEPRHPLHECLCIGNTPMLFDEWRTEMRFVDMPFARAQKRADWARKIWDELHQEELFEQVEIASQTFTRIARFAENQDRYKKKKKPNSVIEASSKRHRSVIEASSTPIQSQGLQGEAPIYNDQRSTIVEGEPLVRDDPDRPVSPESLKDIAHEMADTVKPGENGEVVRYWVNRFMEFELPAKQNDRQRDLWLRLIRKLDTKNLLSDTASVYDYVAACQDPGRSDCGAFNKPAAWAYKKLKPMLGE